MAGLSLAGEKIVGRGLFGIFGLWFKLGLMSIFIGILFIQAISIGIHQQSVLPVIKELGGHFIGLTQSLQIESLKIISSGATFNSWFDFLVSFGKFFFIFYSIYLWLKLFYWIAGNTPLSNQSESFKNLIFSFISFFLLQWFFLFLFSKPLVGQTNLDLFYTPIFAFRDFFHAVILIFSSLNFHQIVSNVKNLNYTTIKTI